MKSGRVLILAVVITTIALFISSKQEFSFFRLAPLLSLSQLTALIGTVLMSIAFVLATRARFVEIIFGGLDRVYRAHAVISVIAFVLLLYHPLLLILNALPDRSLATSFILPRLENLAYAFGIFALLLMVLLISLTVIVNLPYHLWKKTHEYMGVVILLAMFHVVLIKSDTSRFIPLRIWILFWIGAGLISFIYKKFLYHLFSDYLLYRVDQCQRIQDTLDITLAPTNRVLRYHSGQFAFLSVVGHDQISPEEHPYSFSSHPHDPYLRFGIKIVGDHTLKMKDLTVGQVIKVIGPFGQFGDRLYSLRPVVLLSGGIGITTILSLALESAKTRASHPTHIISIFKNDQEAIYQTELEKISLINKNIRHYRHLSSTSGRFTVDILSQIVPDLKQALVFLCGPNSMIGDLRQQLRNFGLRSNQIIFENFNLK